MKLSEYMYIMKVLERLNLEDKYANLEICDVVKRNNENYLIYLNDKNGYPAYQFIIDLSGTKARVKICKAYSSKTEIREVNECYTGGGLVRRIAKPCLYYKK